MGVYLPSFFLSKYFISVNSGVDILVLGSWMEYLAIASTQFLILALLSYQCDHILTT
jgi:hypothetical protein